MNYIGNVTVSTEAIAAMGHFDSILSYVDAMTEAATALDAVDAGVATTAGVAEAVLALETRAPARMNPAPTCRKRLRPAPGRSCR